MKKDPVLFRLTILFLTVLAMVAGGCVSQESSDISTDELYALFIDPPPESKPFVRWWWNGDCVEPEELERELDLLAEAGIGGVEINPIAHPLPEATDTLSCYEWLSPQWNQRVKATAKMASERKMIVDLIMGSGWPFGGEFLDEKRWLQGVGIRKMTLTGPARVTLQLEEVWQLPGRDFGSYNNPDAPDPELFFLRMIPHNASGMTETTDLTNRVEPGGKIEITVPEGSHDLYIGTFQKAYRLVMHGAPGSSGPVVDHYNEADVKAYMDRLGEALGKVLEGSLGDHIRALFCDSIELSGANFTDDFPEEFRKRRGYSLEPCLHLVFYHPYEGYGDTLSYQEAFNDDIRRIRYDFNLTLVELFLERFTATFDRWANQHGMKSRYQAYGMPWLMGMLDGYRMVDIPESNNWLFSGDAKSHGYWIWNKYCASGAHLSGSNLVACEAMTNTRGVFRTTLHMIKKNDDFNFITGINHSILHGFNYSPPEAGFPGWVRYGAYFSEQNSWWPYFPRWTAYNARLSAVFQHSEPVVDVAILTPEADIWQNHGLNRYPYYMNPWYHHDLWEGFSRHGISADYINEGVIRRARAADGTMVSEACRYQLVIVSSAHHMEPETLEAIQKMADSGVRFLFVEHFPSASPGFYEKESRDEAVRELVGKLAGHSSVRRVDPPAGPEQITGWTGRIAEKPGIRSTIRIPDADESIYTAKYRFGGHPVFFISNQDENSGRELQVRLELSGKIPWRWDPETGERSRLPVTGDGELRLHLDPVESMLIVMEDRRGEPVFEPLIPDDNRLKELSPQWEMEFFPVEGDSFVLKSGELISFSDSEDPRVKAFAGEVRYTAGFEVARTGWKFLDLGTEKQITRVFLNGKELGTRWYGRHLYRLEEEDIEDINKLEIRYTTTLANYARSLKDHPAAMQWIDPEQPEPMGLMGPVRLLEAKTE